MLYLVNSVLLEHPEERVLVDLLEEYLKELGMPEISSANSNFQDRIAFYKSVRPLTWKFIQWLLTKGFTQKEVYNSVRISDDL